MSGDQQYKCPHCGCEDRFAQLEGPWDHRREWEKVGGRWKRVAISIVAPFLIPYCPQCANYLPFEAVQLWLKEPQEE